VGRYLSLSSDDAGLKSGVIRWGRADGSGDGPTFLSESQIYNDFFNYADSTKIRTRPYKYFHDAIGCKTSVFRPSFDHKRKFSVNMNFRESISIGLPNFHVPSDSPKQDFHFCVQNSELIVQFGTTLTKPPLNA
jgi:hypothetical protein